jgi:hypothetical protein
MLSGRRLLALILYLEEIPLRRATMFETQEYFKKISEIQEQHQQNHHRAISFYEAIAIFLSELVLEENEQITNWQKKYQN